MYKFAHLLGIKARATDEHEEDENAREAKSRRAEEEEHDENAEDDKDREDAEKQDDEKENKKAKKAKKAKSEDDDDDPDAEDDKDDADADENEDVKKGRRAERKRCAKIFGSKHAAGRSDIAAHLAFNTRLSAHEAINTLSVMGAVTPPSAKSRPSLDERMRNEKQVRLGPDAQVPVAGSAEAAVATATALYNRVKGKQ
ncbi:hypothetical protein HGO23_13025 [Xenorhabdus budapestensis]|uniref:DNA primase n=1 Tax=Xenorhabdus budapestensis TaxID=290110 RepID=A0ABX7VD95_XENBU|nr:hypothetical protein [Xenorhabdus budapestensis]QTL38796.1 hypothetical protein HGO23_13025 [Xenorhabdus budapestensis]